MRLRIASINDLPIKESERQYHWPLGRRPDDHPSLSDFGFRTACHRPLLGYYPHHVYGFKDRLPASSSARDGADPPLRKEMNT